MSIDARQEVWIGKEVITLKNPLNPNFANLKIADLINHSNWDTNKIWNLYGRENAEKILTTHIALQEEINFEWIHTKNGNYSTKTGYWLLQNKDSCPSLLKVSLESLKFSKMEIVCLEDRE